MAWGFGKNRICKFRGASKWFFILDPAGVACYNKGTVAPPKFSLVVSRIFLIVAVLFGQLTGGSACCCWVRQFVGPTTQSLGDLAASDDATETFACPKCQARFKKSQRTTDHRDRVDGAPCQCGTHGSIAIHQEPDSESRVRFEATLLGPDPDPLPIVGVSRQAPSSMDGHSLLDRLAWQSRACIWRI